MARKISRKTSKRKLLKPAKTSSRLGKSDLNLSELNKFIEKTTRKAGQLVKKDFRKLKITDIWSKKGLFMPSLVTKTDKNSEHFILTELWHYADKHNLVFKVRAEEGGEVLLIPQKLKGRKVRPKPDLIWHVDPLDGTNNFVFGVGFFAVCIAAEKKGKIISGAVYNPLKNEMFIAKNGKSYLNGKKLRTKDRVAPVVRRINVSISRKPKDMEYLRRLIVKYKIAVKACASLSTCEIAAGRADASVHFTPMSWDIAAANAVLEGAGGIATDFKGNKWTPKDMPTLAANKSFIKELVKTINKKQN